MPDNYASQPLADLKAQAAERVFVECPGDYPHHETLCECKGTRKKPLLRQPCEHHHSSSYKGLTGCPGYVFNDTEDAVPDAIAAMGLISVTNTYGEGRGIDVRIESMQGGLPANVRSFEGITSLTHALLIALLRAVDSQENKEND